MTDDFNKRVDAVVVNMKHLGRESSWLEDDILNIILALQQQVKEREDVIYQIRERITDVNYKTFPKGSTEYEDDTPGYIIGIVELIDETMAEHKEG